MRDWEADATDVLPTSVYDFFAGGAGREVTVDDNPSAWDRLRLRPRVLRPVGGVDTTTTVLGTPVSSPVLVAPVGYQRLAHPEGELATAEGVRRAGGFMVVSTRSSTRIEDVATELAAPWWFQTYVMRDRARTVDLVRRAAASGCRALVLTGDTPLVATKPRDRRNGFEMPPDHRLAGVDAGSQQDPATSFDDIAWLTETSGLPVLVKGVLRADDARSCLAAGAAGVVVSNHGGRQLDGAVSTADAVGGVVQEVGDEVEVYVDGGIRSGSDVLKALALGVRAVMVGRPVIWGLAVDGAAGAAAVLVQLRRELEEVLVLSGASSVAEVTPDLVVPWH